MKTIRQFSLRPYSGQQRATGLLLALERFASQCTDYQFAKIVQRQTTEVLGDFGRLYTDLETAVLLALLLVCDAQTGQAAGLDRSRPATGRVKAAGASRHQRHLHHRGTFHWLVAARCLRHHSRH